MSTAFSQRRLQNTFLVILLITSTLVVLYHIFFWILSIAAPNNNIYSMSMITAVITIFGFYFSIVPIKSLSTAFPSWYDISNSAKFPYSHDFGVFLMEQIFVVIFMTISIFVVYILIMWARRIYRRLLLKKKDFWSTKSVALGIFAIIYYVFILLIAITLVSEINL